MVRSTDERSSVDLIMICASSKYGSSTQNPMMKPDCLYMKGQATAFWLACWWVLLWEGPRWRLPSKGKMLWMEPPVRVVGDDIHEVQTLRF